MNERIKKLKEQASKWVCENEPRALDDDQLFSALSLEKFAELIVQECMNVARQQRNPANLNYKPSERFVEDLQRHFGK